MNFFKPSDFYPGTDCGEDIFSYVDAANRANAKLEREGKVVYGGFAGHPIHTWTDYMPHKYGDLVKAVLINIEPIEACKHPLEKIRLVNVASPDKASWSNVGVYKCECGVQVRPKEYEEIK